MKALQGLREVLKDLAREVEVLPAVGGAVEDLERPDFEDTFRGWEARLRSRRPQASAR